MVGSPDFLLVVHCVGLVCERQVLDDSVKISRSKERSLSHGTTAFGLFALHQMTPACPVEQHFAGRGHFETFCHGLPCLNAFGASHKVTLSFVVRETFSGAGRVG